MNSLVDIFVDEIFDNSFAYASSILNMESNLLRDDWVQFKNSWNNLPLDNYMGDGGRYRFRRYSVFHWSNQIKSITLKPHEPHYQSIVYNHLNGGVPRYYEPFEYNVINSLLLNNIILFALNVINKLESDSDWHIEAHQFRIIASDSISKPTPEGVHCDGRDYIIMMLIDKCNVFGGVSTIYDNSRNILKEINLKNSGETLMLCDNSTMHGVTPIKAYNNMEDGYRDMLVITFINQEKLNDK